MSQFLLMSVLVGAALYVASNDHVQTVLIKLEDTMTRVDNIVVQVERNVIEEHLIEQMRARAFEFMDDADIIMHSARQLTTHEGLVELARYALNTSMPESATQGYAAALHIVDNADNITSIVRHICEDIEQHHEELPKAYNYLREHTNYTEIVDHAKSLYADAQIIMDLLANFQGITFIDGRQKKLVDVP